MKAQKKDKANVSGSGYQLEELIDHVVWAGDFNYRVGIDRPKARTMFYHQKYEVK